MGRSYSTYSRYSLGRLWVWVNDMISSSMTPAEKDFIGAYLRFTAGIIDGDIIHVSLFAFFAWLWNMVFRSLGEAVVPYRLYATDHAGWGHMIVRPNPYIGAYRAKENTPSECPLPIFQPAMSSIWPASLATRPSAVPREITPRLRHCRTDIRVKIINLLYTVNLSEPSNDSASDADLYSPHKGGMPESPVLWGGGRGKASALDV